MILKLACAIYFLVLTVAFAHASSVGSEARGSYICTPSGAGQMTNCKPRPKPKMRPKR